MGKKLMLVIFYCIHWCFLLGIVNQSLCMWEVISSNEKGTVFEEVKDSFVCSQIKELNSNTCSEIDQCIEYLVQYKLTVGDCVQNISQKRERKAFQEVVKEWSITDEELARVRVALEIMREQDRGLQPSVVLKSVIVPELRKLIEQKIKDFNITIPLHVLVENFNSSSIAEVGRGMNENLEAYDYISLSINEFYLRQENFFLPRLDAVLQHEFMHVKYEDSIKKRVLLQVLNKRNNQDVKMVYKPLKSQSFLKWQRAQEARCDREGQACCVRLDTVNNMHRRQLEIINWKSQLYNNIKGDKLLSTHPPDQKRYLWAKKIEALRICEEQRKKKL